MNAVKASNGVLSLLLAIGLGMMSCSKFDSDNGYENPDMLKAKGTIAGRIIDMCTNAPVKGVKVSIAENGTTVTTDNFGEFVFKSVPVNALDTPNGMLYNNSYVIIMDFTAYNQTLADTSALRYNNHEYVTVDVVFTDLNDGDNDGTGGDAGSGQDTPADHLVANVELLIGKLNTQISGQVVDNLYNPVAGAVVYLKKNLNYTGTWSLIKQTTTDASGNYVFSNVEAGSSVTIEAMNSSRTMSGDVSIDLTCNQNTGLRTQVAAEQIVLTYDDDVSPFVTVISPVNNEDAGPTGLTVTYTFSEPIKQTPYTRTDLGKGHNTIVDDIVVTFVGMKKAASAVPFTVTWNAAFTQLTLTPSGIVGSARYTVNNFISNKLMDNAGNAVVNNAGITGDFETLSFTTAGSAAAPTTPSLSRETLMYPLTNVNWNGGTVKLRWDYDANVKYYELYKKIGDGSFEIVGNNIKKIDTVVTVGGTDLVVGDNQSPSGKRTVQYAIRAISNNLVSSEMSNAITVEDKVLPTLTSATIDSNISADYDVVYVRFSEPLTRTTAESGTYSISPDNNSISANVREIIYLGYDTSFPGGSGYKVRFKVNNRAITTGERLTVTGVEDLHLNDIDTENNSHDF